LKPSLEHAPLAYDMSHVDEPWYLAEIVSMRQWRRTHQPRKVA